MTCQASMELTEKLTGPNTTVLDVCLMLHGSNTGMSDPLSDEDEEESLNLLKMMLVKWTNPHASSQRFDDAVKTLIEATILETELNRYKNNEYLKREKETT